MPMIELKEAAAQLAGARLRPCLLFVVPEIRRDCLVPLREAMGKTTGKGLDLILHSHGGDIHAAYVAAREIKRRFEHVTVFVPVAAKSAAMLLCLIADELVLGSLGELGPLDGQYQPPDLANASADRSGLLPFKALDQLNDALATMYQFLVERFMNTVYMKGSDACSQASELTSAVLGPLYAQIPPTVLAESARGLELGIEHAERLLRRYRPRLPEPARHELVERLVHAYPCHCFPIDHEELQELGFPVRPATPTEEGALEGIAAALLESQSEPETVITVVGLEDEPMDDVQCLRSTGH
jgi:hypothetical protein